jgi:hypothetical protein
MAGYETSIDREEADTMGITGRNLITGLSESLSFLSIESRTNRQKEKLRSELVSEHIDNRKQTPSLLQSLADTLTRPL